MPVTELQYCKNPFLVVCTHSPTVMVSLVRMCTLTHCGRVRVRVSRSRPRCHWQLLDNCIYRGRLRMGMRRRAVMGCRDIRAGKFNKESVVRAFFSSKPALFPDGLHSTTHKGTPFSGISDTCKFHGSRRGHMLLFHALQVPSSMPIPPRSPKSAASSSFRSIVRMNEYMSWC